jgi:hypothetical protein
VVLTASHPRAPRATAALLCQSPRGTKWEWGHCSAQRNPRATWKKLFSHILHFGAVLGNDGDCHHSLSSYFGQVYRPLSTVPSCNLSSKLSNSESERGWGVTNNFIKTKVWARCVLSNLGYSITLFVQNPGAKCISISGFWGIYKGNIVCVCVGGCMYTLTPINTLEGSGWHLW